MLSSQSVLIKSRVGVRWDVGFESPMCCVTEDADSFEVDAARAPRRAVLIARCQSKEGAEFSGIYLAAVDNSLVGGVRTRRSKNSDLGS